MDYYRKPEEEIDAFAELFSDGKYIFGNDGNGHGIENIDALIRHADYLKENNITIAFEFPTQVPDGKGGKISTVDSNGRLDISNFRQGWWDRADKVRELQNLGVDVIAYDTNDQTEYKRDAKIGIGLYSLRQDGGKDADVENNLRKNLNALGLSNQEIDRMTDLQDPDAAEYHEAFLKERLANDKESGEFLADSYAKHNGYGEVGKKDGKLFVLHGNSHSLDKNDLDEAFKDRIGASENDISFVNLSTTNTGGAGIYYDNPKNPLHQFSQERHTEKTPEGVVIKPLHERLDKSVVLGRSGEADYHENPSNKKSYQEVYDQAARDGAPLKFSNYFERGVLGVAGVTPEGHIETTVDVISGGNETGKENIFRMDFENVPREDLQRAVNNLNEKYGAENKPAFAELKHNDIGPSGERKDAIYIYGDERGQINQMVEDISGFYKDNPERLEQVKKEMIDRFAPKDRAEIQQLVDETSRFYKSEHLKEEVHDFARDAIDRTQDFRRRAPEVIKGLAENVLNQGAELARTSNELYNEHSPTGQLSNLAAGAVNLAKQGAEKFKEESGTVVESLTKRAKETVADFNSMRESFQQPQEEKDREVKENQPTADPLLAEVSPEVQEKAEAKPKSIDFANLAEAREIAKGLLDIGVTRVQESAGELVKGVGVGIDKLGEAAEKFKKDEIAEAKPSDNLADNNKTKPNDINGNDSKKPHYTDTSVGADKLKKDEIAEENNSKKPHYTDTSVGADNYYPSTDNKPSKPQDLPNNHQSPSNTQVDGNVNNFAAIYQSSMGR